MKKIIKDYFTFSKKERTAVIVLLLLIGFFIAAPYFYSARSKPPVINKALEDYLAKTKNAIADSSDDPATLYHVPEEKSNIKKESFPFDPNTISADGWKRLGLSDKTVRTIFNYRNKGGKFRSPEDLRKVWGIKKEDADRLIPFVRLEEAIQVKQKSFEAQAPKQAFINKEKIKNIDINTASAEEWKALPGIGDVLANRIIKFRERLGGFTSLEQLKKTYGISDSVFQSIGPYLKLDVTSVPKININTASAYELRTKANVPEAVAKAIVVYRQQYGPYQSVNDLKKIVLMNDSLFQRVVSALSVQ